MATTPACIYGKIPSKSSSTEPVDRFSRDLVCSIRDTGPITFCSNDDPRLTLTYFMTWSNLVVCVFELGKLLNDHLMERKTCSNKDLCL